MRRSVYITSLVCLAAGVTGCSDTINHYSTDAGMDIEVDGGTDGGMGEGVAPDLREADGGSDGPGGATLSIYIKGDPSPVTFTDGLAGQTPKANIMGLGRFDILKAPNDPSPVTVFDHGNSPVEVDMLGTTLGGSARIADLPAGTYTHGRVLLTKTAFTVAARVHAVIVQPLDLQVISALSDTVINGQPWTQGQSTISVLGYTIPILLPGLPSTGGGSIVQVGGKTWMVFPFPQPITLSPLALKDRKATIIYKVFESFRWEDQPTAGYAQGEFDVDGLALSYEPVKSFGASGYGVELD